MVKSEVEASSGGETINEDETNAGFSVGGGLELVVEPNVLIDLGLDYSKVEEEDGVDGNIGLGCWFNPKVMGGISGSYDFDDGDASASLTFIVKL